MEPLAIRNAILVASPTAFASERTVYTPTLTRQLLHAYSYTPTLTHVILHGYSYTPTLTTLASAAALTTLASAAAFAAAAAALSAAAAAAFSRAVVRSGACKCRRVRVGVQE